MPPAYNGPPVTVVGARVAGCVCATTLADRGFAVTLIEMGRGPGSRMSQRREISSDGNELHFDHGAQYFTVKFPAVQTVVDGRIGAGLVKEWAGWFGGYDRVKQPFQDETLNISRHRELRVASRSPPFSVVKRTTLVNLWAQGFAFLVRTERTEIDYGDGLKYGGRKESPGCSAETEPATFCKNELKWCDLCGSRGGWMMCGSCMGEGGYVTKPGLAGMKGKVGWSRCKTCFGRKLLPCIFCGRRDDGYETKKAGNL